MCYFGVLGFFSSSEAIIKITSRHRSRMVVFFLYALGEGIMTKNMLLVIALQYHEICDSCETERKMAVPLPFIYEKPPAFTTNFLLLRLILACKLSGMLTKLPATELCVLTFSFLC